MAHWRGGLGASEGRSVVWPLRAVLRTVTSRISGYSFQQRIRYTNTARLYYALGRSVPVFSSVFGRVDCYVVYLRGVRVHLLLTVHYKIQFYVRFCSRFIQDMTYAHAFSQYQLMSFRLSSLLLLRAYCSFI